MNTDKCYTTPALKAAAGVCNIVQKNTSVCPIYEDGMAA